MLTAKGHLMAKTHYWFGTDKDNALIIDWLTENGAIPIYTTFDALDYNSRQDILLHFPDIGPIELWPKKIKLSKYPENSPRWREALLIRADQKQNPHRRK